MNDQSNHEHADCTDQLWQRVQQAVKEKSSLHIVGNSTKAFLAPAGFGHQSHATSDILNTVAHSGIVSYEPTELVLTARAGTTIRELRETLAASGQCMPFEPPVYAENDTIGGVIACGLSGPARAYTGSARDYVLGMHMINGKAEKVSFGGEVMKNVAGYDVSRLQTGAMGTLGLILDVSMKVLPQPEAEQTCVLELSGAAKSPLTAMARQPLPLSASAIVEDGGKRTVYVRLSGSAAAVAKAASQIGGDTMPDAGSFWRSLANHSHAFFSASDERRLWRISVADFADDIALQGTWLQEWGGAQRWLQSDEPAEKIFATTQNLGGHATCYSPLPEGEGRFQPLTGPMLALQRELKLAFDPELIFNPGCFHPEISG